MAEKYFLQNNWDGGLSDSNVYGLNGSYVEGVGIDIRSEPKTFSAQHKLSLATGTVVDDFCTTGLIWGARHWFFGGNDGDVYYRTDAGVWSQVYSAGTRIYGVAYYDNYFYWATNTALNRTSTGSISGGSTFAQATTTSWGTLNSVQTSYLYYGSHQMTINGLYLYILNGRYMATVDDTGTLYMTGTPDIDLSSLPPNYIYSTMSNFGIDLIMGVNEIYAASPGKVCRWDTVSPFWNQLDDVPHSNINAFIPIDNYVLVQAGSEGNLYYYDGNTLSKYRKLYGNYDNKGMIVYPGSVCPFQGYTLFGVSSWVNDTTSIFSGNALNQGVYSIGQLDKNYNMSINLDYPISTGSLNNVTIGAITAYGTVLCVAWRNGTAGSYTYGIDELNWASRYNGAYLKTLAIGGDRFKQKEFKSYDIDYLSKPTGTDIALSYNANYGTSSSTITLDNQSGYSKMSGDQSIEAGVIQLKITLTTSSNSTPKVENLYASWNEREI